VAQRQVRIVLSEFQRTVRDCRRLADDARRWSLPGGSPHISINRRDLMIEIAFLRAFLAWEGFLEESCVLYMLGQRPLRGRALVRYVLPPNRRMAQALAAGGREYAKWDGAAEVASRAERFFREGRPYASVLRGVQNTLNDAKTVRNAVAHDSESARQKFEGLVRRELTRIPPRLTVGSFLNTARLGVAPPQSFLEFYLDTLDQAADQIARP